MALIELRSTVAVAAEHREEYAKASIVILHP
jgi:hypothetical protein